ncbi:MAG: class I SAM-dependent methyltransferase [Lachnospiraceae bacterium]|jgi:Methylase involved in ubiquinone/menaquinone biosynthesis
MSEQKGLEWTFDTVAEKYERMRPSYPQDLYDDIFKAISINISSKAVEIGIGGGQATLPILETGCDVLAVEYGKNFTQLCREKFKQYKNFSVVPMKFEEYSCESNSYDLVYSASAFHWVPEEIGYTKVFDILKRGGVFARFANHPYQDIGREEMSQAIQELYAIYLSHSRKPNRYTDEQAKNLAEIANKYGFTDIDYKLYDRTRTFTAEEYVDLLNTYSDHNALAENVKKEFFGKVKDTINQYGGHITIYDTIDLQLARKP